MNKAYIRSLYKQSQAYINKKLDTAWKNKIDNQTYNNRLQEINRLLKVEALSGKRFLVHKLNLKQDGYKINIGNDFVRYRHILTRLKKHYEVEGFYVKVNHLDLSLSIFWDI
jgi:hypothetical protein